MAEHGPNGDRAVTDPSTVLRRRVLIDGRVQDVGFRFACVRQATAAGVVGWVRNLPDGRVEAVLQGDAAAVERLVAWCHSGPAGAVVSSVEVSDETPSPARGFVVR